MATGIKSIYGNAMRIRKCVPVTMDEIGSGSTRDPEGSIDAGFNLGHKVGDGTFFDVILLIVFNPEIPCEDKKNNNIIQNCRMQKRLSAVSDSPCRYRSLKKKVASPRVDTASKVMSGSHLFCRCRG